MGTLITCLTIPRITRDLSKDQGVTASQNLHRGSYSFVTVDISTAILQTGWHWPRFVLVIFLNGF
jgi:hypothetical protein